MKYSYFKIIYLKDNKKYKKVLNNDKTMCHKKYIQ